MAKRDPRTGFDRFETALAEHGYPELVSSFEALMRALAAKLPHRGAPRLRPDGQERRQSEMAPPSRPSGVRQRRRPDGPDAIPAEGARRLAADPVGKGAARLAKRNRATRTGKAT